MEWSNQSTACGNYSPGLGRAGRGGGAQVKGCRGMHPTMGGITLPQVQAGIEGKEGDAKEASQELASM